MSIISDLRSFQEGDSSAFWDILEADRIKDKITYYTSSATRIYQLSSHDSEDFHHELVLSLQRKLKTYSLNQEHDDFHLENSLLNYMNLFFIGESERIAKTICGLMTKDDKGFFKHQRQEVFLR